MVVLLDANGGMVLIGIALVAIAIFLWLASQRDKNGR